MFDKTGTLTSGGEPIVTDHWVLGASDVTPPDWLKTIGPNTLEIVKHLEINSSHTIAKALVSFCNGRCHVPCTKCNDTIANLIPYSSIRMHKLYSC